MDDTVYQNNSSNQPTVNPVEPVTTTPPVENPVQVDNSKVTTSFLSSEPPVEDDQNQSNVSSEATTPNQPIENQPQDFTRSYYQPESQPIAAEPSGFANQTSSDFQTIISDQASSPPPASYPVSASSSFLSGNKKLLIIIPLLLIGIAAAFLFFKKLTSVKNIITSEKIVYWGLWEEESVMTAIINDYQKTHPKSKITYIKQSPIQYRERLQNALARGEGPDIFRMHNTWVPMLKNDLAPIPSTVFNNNTYEKTFYPVSLKDFKIGTSYYGIPLYMDTLALYINEDLFEKAGLSPPTTWEDLRKDASLLTEREEDGRIKVAGVALGTTGNVDHWSDILGLMMIQNGVDFKKVDQTIDPKGQNRGENTLSYYTQYSLMDKVWDETLPASTSLFAAGKLAMYFAPSWRVFEIKAANPDLKFKIMPVPQLAGNNANWATYWAEGVAKKSTNQAAAWEFLKYLSSKETLVKFYNEASKARLFGELYGRQDMADLLKDDPLVSTFVDQAKTSRSWYLCSRTFDGDDGLDSRMIKYFEDGINAVLKGASISEALKTITQGVNQLSTLYQLQ